MCRQLATSITPQDLEFNRVHRALGLHSTDLNRLRDVIYCLHRYSHKDLILCRAWEVGDINFDRAKVKILPDLSKATLQRRALLCPLLDKLRQLGFTY